MIIVYLLVSKQNILVLTARRGEDVTSRTVSYILNDPINDGGQWDMVVNLVTKHGLMPKKCFPETFSCESSSRLNGILKSKLREYAKELRGHIAGGASDDALVAAQCRITSSAGSSHIAQPPEIGQKHAHDAHPALGACPPRAGSAARLPAHIQ